MWFARPAETTAGEAVQSAAPVLMMPPELMGTMPGEWAVGIVNTYVTTFFDQHLRGEDMPLLDGSSPDYPEVTFESRGG